MSQQEYPQHQIDFVQAVHEMREAQDDYFKQPNNYRLRVAKMKEQKVDQLLAPYRKEGVIKTKQTKITNQQNLFNA